MELLDLTPDGLLDAVDSQTAGVIPGLFRSLASRYGVNVVIVTHDTAIALTPPIMPESDWIASIL